MDWRFYREQQQEGWTRALDRYLTSVPEEEDEYEPTAEEDIAFSLREEYE